MNLNVCSVLLINMPNECINRITITSKTRLDLDSITATIAANYAIHVIQRGPYGIRLQVDTNWKPDYLWLQSLIDAFPSCWIKDEWIVEDGKAGVWIGYTSHWESPDGTRTPLGSTKRFSSTEWEDLSLEAENYFFNE